MARASERLHLTPQTISGQLSLLEDYPGLDLSSRVGRKLERTDTGGMVLGYAYEIVSLGGELEEVIHQRILMPALQTSEPVRMLCREVDLDALLAELAVHRLDLVLSDRPIPPHSQYAGFQSQVR